MIYATILAMCTLIGRECYRASKDVIKSILFSAICGAVFLAAYYMALSI